MTGPSPKYTSEELVSDAISKKDLIVYLQETASFQFLLDNKLKGAVKNVVKTKSKEQLIENYQAMFDTQAFSESGDAAKEEEATTATAAAKLADKAKKMSISEDKDVGPPKYVKHILKKGDKTNFPRKGDTVACFYTGKLADGTVFDQNAVATKKYRKPQPLRFKVGVGLVIRGWDDVLLTMSAGEKAEVIIEPEWAYGKKGLEGKVPANATLHFEVELVTIE